MTEAMRRYAVRARLGLEAQNHCAELRLRAPPDREAKTTYSIIKAEKLSCRPNA